MQYVELHARSAFSFLEGGSLPEALVMTAAGLGLPAMALLDRNGFYGSARFHMAAKKSGLRAYVGTELSIACESGTIGYHQEPYFWPGGGRSEHKPEHNNRRMRATESILGLPA